MGLFLNFDSSDDDLDKYMDPEAYYDPYWCGECDEFFTSTAAFEVHMLLHNSFKSSNSFRGVGGRGGRRGGGKPKGKKKTKGRAKPKAVSSDESSDDDGSSEFACFMEAMAFMASYSEMSDPSMKPRERRSKNSHAPRAACRRQQRYSCGHCNKFFAVKGDYWYHMTRAHRECVACGLKSKTDVLMDDHFRATPSCLGWPVGMSDGSDSVSTDEEMPDLMHCPPVVSPSASVVPANCGRDCARNSTATEAFPCLLCDEIPPSGIALNHHMRSIHHKCLRCRVQFESPAKLLEHFSKSKQHRFCQTCSVDFLCKEELETHDKAHHRRALSSKSKGKMKSGDSSATKAGSYGCQFCTRDMKSFSTLEKLESHLQREHIRCFPCRREFISKNSLSMHLQMHSSHNYCHFCDTDFVSAEALNRHASICISRSKLDPCANADPSDATAPKIEQAVNAIAKTGNEELNSLTDPAEEMIDSDKSEWETVDGDEGDSEESDPVPVVKRPPVPLSRNAPVDAREKDLSGTVGKEAPETLSTVAQGNSETITLSGTSVRHTPVLLSAETPGSKQGRNLSGESVKQAPLSVCLETPSSQQERDLSGAAVQVDDRFICSACGENAGSGIALNQHCATNHSRCQRCNIQFDSQTDLLCHFSNSEVHWQKFCDICKLGFSSTEGWSAHNAASHLAKAKNIPKKFFRCDVCTWWTSFDAEEKLEAHLQCEHMRCFPCMREFGEMKALSNHLTQSTKHNYCAGCETDFVSSQSLSSHGCPGLPWKVTRVYQTNHCISTVPSKMEGTTLDWRTALLDEYIYDSS